MRLLKQKILFNSPGNISILLSNKHLYKTVLWLNGNLGKKKYIIPNEINVVNNKEFLTISTYKYFYYKFCVLYYILLRNDIYGVIRGFKVYLLVKGLGYKVSIDNNILTLRLGFSHNITYKIPSGITITILPKKLKAFKIFGSDFQLIKEVSVRLKNFKKPNNYKIQGIFFYREKKKLKDSKKKSR